MYSFVINIVIEINKAEELFITIQMLGFINSIVELVIVDPDLVKNNW